MDYNTLQMRMKSVLTDPLLYKIMSHHSKGEEVELDWDLADEMKKCGADLFTISQYLLGVKYYQERISNVFGSGKILLDLGCGAGNWSIAGSKFFDKVVGVDINESRINIARQLTVRFQVENKVTFKIATFTELNEADMIADAVICYNVLHVMATSYVNAFVKIRSLVRPGALFYITVTEKGYLVYLFFQALTNFKFTMWFSFAYTLYLNLKYLVGLRKQPYAWINRKFMISILHNSGWTLLHTGDDAEFNNKKSRPIFSKKFMGFSFMKEYVLKAT